MSVDRYVPRMITVLAARLGDGRTVIIHPDNSTRLVEDAEFDAAFEPEAADRGPSCPPIVQHVRRRRKVKRVTKRSSKAALTNRSTATPEAPHLRRRARKVPAGTVIMPGPARRRRRIEEGAAQLDDRDEPREMVLSHPNAHNHDAEITAGLDALAVQRHGQPDPTRPHRKVCGFCAYTSKLSAPWCRRPSCGRTFPPSSIQPDPA